MQSRLLVIRVLRLLLCSPQFVGRIDLGVSRWITSGVKMMENEVMVERDFGCGFGDGSSSFPCEGRILDDLGDFMAEK